MNGGVALSSPWRHHCYLDLYDGDGDDGGGLCSLLLLE